MLKSFLQSATRFLRTNAHIVVALLVLVGVLWYFGVRDTTAAWYFADVSTVESRVAQSSDDAEECLADNLMYLTSSDIELTYEGPGGPCNAGDQEVGLRFQNINIPQGAKITNAYIEFETDETTSTTTNVTFHSQAIDDAPTFSTTTADITSRTTNSQTVDWNDVSAWDTVDEKHQTPNLSDIIQPVVDRNGWNSGNAVVVTVTGEGRRIAEAYDGESANAPLLHVEYTESDTTWDHRQKITINSSKVDSNLSDFPVYVDLSDLPAHFHSNVRSDGGDIRVTSDDGTTELAREIVSYDAGSDTGELHFKASSLSASSDTEFYIYYGNAEATDYATDATYGAENVWTNGYEAVYHDGGGTDSTGNGNDGTGNGGITIDGASGQVGGGTGFDGTDDYIDVGDISEVEQVSEIAVSMWFNLDTAPSTGPDGFDLYNFGDNFNDYVTTRISDDNSSAGFLWHVENRNHTGSAAVEGDNFSSSVIATSTWTHVTGVYDGSNPESWLYLDGSLDSTTTDLPTLTPPSTQAHNIGRLGFNDDRYIDGRIDELRISSSTRSADWVSAEYSNQNDTTSFYTIGSVENDPASTFGEQSSDGWGDDRWDHRQKITIKSSQVDSNLTDFPVYVDLADLSSGFHDNVASNGGDIRMTTADGETEIPREIVSYDASSDTGELHFKAPSLSASSDTEFYIYYRNTEAEDYASSHTYGAENVWTNDYVAVYHMQEDPSGSAPQMLDSTANNNDGTSNGSMTSTSSVSGFLSGQALDFDETDDYLGLPSSLSDALDGFTISLWTQSSYDSAAVYFDNFNDLGPDGVRFRHHGSFADFVVGIDGGNRELNFSSDPRNGEWRHISGTYSSSDGAMALYVDGGVDAQTASSSGSINTSDQSANIGRDDRDIHFINSTLDEVRISHSARSADWISTEYSNQNSSSTFYVFGSQEEVPAAAFGEQSSDGWGDDRWEYRQKITIQASEIDSDLTDFPVYIDLSDLTSDFHSNVRSDGGDIRVTSDDGTTELAREIVSYDAGSDTGELHFKASSLSASSDTEFYIYYGNAEATDYATDATYGAENVWSSNYEFVSHDGGGTDSTANQHSVTSVGSPSEVSGRVGAATDFAGANMYLLSDEVMDAVETNSAGTWSGWAYLTDISSVDNEMFYVGGQIKAWQDVGGSGLGWAMAIWDSGGAAPIIGADDNNAAVDTWQKVSFIWDGATMRAYVNGIETASGSKTEIATSSEMMGLGGQGDTTQDPAYEGLMDEVRIVSTAHSADWEAAEYTNQNDTTSFYTVGSQEAQLLFTDLTATPLGQNSAEGSFYLDTDNGTVYAVVTKSGTAPTRREVKAGKNHHGETAVFSDSRPVEETGTIEFFTDSLSSGQTYAWHFMHESENGVQSTVESTDTFRTDFSESYPWYSGENSVTQTVESRVSQSSDDAEEKVSSSTVDIASSDLELVVETDQGEQEVGMRFDNLDIPKGAVISNAYIEFETDETNTGTTNLTFHSEAIDDAPTFTTDTGDITNRTTNSETVDWSDVPAWDTVDEKHQTPNLTDIIQPVVDRGGWSSGNALVVTVTGDGERTAEAYDGEPANAPLLHVEYTTDAEGVWEYRQKITIDSEAIDENLTDFPVYVDLTDFPAHFHNNMNADGGDIRVTTADGETEVPREVVSTGELHFKAPTLSSTSSTEFYIYYGNSEVEDYETDSIYGAENVWSDYEAVWHLDEDPLGSAPQFIDATGNGYDATATGTASGDISRVTGKTGNGVQLNQENGSVLGKFLEFGPEIVTDIGNGEARTFTAWVQQYDDDRNTIFGDSTNLTDNIRFFDNDTFNRFTLSTGGSSHFFPYSTEADTWYKATMTMNNGSVNAYVNATGNADNPQAFSESLEINNLGRGRHDTDFDLSGILDEARIANFTASQAWDTAEYTNQNDPTTFYTVGNREAGVDPETLPPTLTTPEDTATGVSRTPTLAWDVVSNSLEYQVQVATSSGFESTTVDATVSTTSLSLGPPQAVLDGDETYHWRVRKVDESGTNDWSSTFEFTTETGIVGSGTEADPYLVSTPQDLNAVRNDLTAYYEQVADIDLTFDTQDPAGDFYNSGSGWAPIGGDFTGTFDGGGHKITGLFFSRGAAGLFDTINGVVHDFGLEGDVESSGNDVALLASVFAGGEIYNIYVKGSLTVVSGSRSRQGGVFGRASVEDPSAAVHDVYTDVNIYGDLDINSATAIGRNFGSESANVTNTYAVGAIVDTPYSTTINAHTAWGTDVSNSFFDTETSGDDDDPRATPKTTSEMQSISTFDDSGAGWDIVDISQHDGQKSTATWYIDDGNDYPRLWFELGDVDDTDSTPPTPDPMTFSTSPEALSPGAITMTATEATDASSSTPIEYNFTAQTCASDAGTGADDSGWQTDRTYTDTDLDANQCYQYVVRARDSAGNTTATSSAAQTYTMARTPGTPTVSNLATTSLDITNDENGNSTTSPTTTFAVQIENSSPDDATWEGQYVDGSGNPSGAAVWLTDAQLDGLTISGLESGTEYTVQVKARNEDGTETSFSQVVRASTIDNTSTQTGTSTRLRGGSTIRGGSIFR